MTTDYVQDTNGTGTLEKPSKTDLVRDALATLGENATSPAIHEFILANNHVDIALKPIADIKCKLLKRIRAERGQRGPVISSRNTSGELNINRRGNCWRFQFKRKGRYHYKQFADSLYGGSEGAKATAIKYRDEFMKSQESDTPVSNKGHGRTPDHGEQYITRREKNHCWRFQVHLPNGKVYSKQFSDARHADSKELSFAAAAKHKKEYFQNQHTAQKNVIAITTEPPSQGENKVRVYLNLSQNDQDRINYLKEQLGFDNMSDIARLALERLFNTDQSEIADLATTLALIRRVGKTKFTVLMDMV